MRRGGWARWAGWAGTVGIAAVVGLALILGIAPRAGAHSSGPGGDPTVIHVCVDRKGIERIVGDGVACGAGETPLHRKGAGRFIDTGRTVFDTATGLEWEKKTTAVGSGVNAADLHDVDNPYSWCVATGDATPGTRCAGNTESWIADVNAEGFAGHSDWRVPSLAELQSIVDVSVAGCGSDTPCIDPIFGPTQAAVYWSSTEFDAGLAWGVYFFNGDAVANFKFFPKYVRAVRGGP